MYCSPLRLLSLSAALCALPLTAFSQTWTRVRSEAASDLVAVHFADAQNGYIAGALGTLLKTTDGGETWTTVQTPSNVSFVSVAARSADEVFIGRVGLYRTADSGGQWDTDVGGFEDFFGSIFDVLFINANEGVLTKAGAIFATGDGGTQWEMVADTGLFLDDLHHPGGRTLFATGGITYSEIFGFVSRGEMARSRDGGETWDILQTPGINEIHAAIWENEQKGTVFTFTNKAHHTEDGGDTWELLTGEMTDLDGNPLPDIIMDAVIDDTGLIVAVDFGGNFLESIDGTQWVVTPGSGESFSALTKLPDGSLIAVGNSGNIWKRPPADPVTLPLAIEDIRYDSGKNTVTLDITGTLGADYSLEVSHDLTRWEGTKITTAPASRFSITIDAPSGATKAYFRVAEVLRLTK